MATLPASRAHPGLGLGAAAALAAVMLVAQAPVHGLAALATSPDSAGSCVTATVDPAPFCPTSTARLTTPNSANDYATAVATTAHHVFVSGVSSAGEVVTLALDPASGTQTWSQSVAGSTARYATTLLAVSPNAGTVYVAIQNGSGVDLYAYAADTGTQLWTTATPSVLPPVPSPTGSGQQSAYAVHLDATAAAVIATVDNGGALEVDAYSPAGSAGQAVQLWTSSGLPTDPATVPRGAALSADGSTIYVCGRSGTVQQPQWSVTALETAHGTQKWQVTPAGDEANAVAVSPDGSTVVATGITGYTDMTTRALRAADGGQLWSDTVHPPPTNGQQALDAGTAAVISADSGTVFVGGYIDAFYDDQHFHKTYPLLDYRVADGSTVWSDSLPGPDNYGDPDIHLALAGGPLLGVSTRLPGTAGGYDISTDGVDPATGAVAWNTVYSGPSGGDNAPAAIAAGGTGFVVVGYSHGTTTRADYVAQSLDSAGNSLWVARHDNAATPVDEMYASAMSPDGATEYLTGLTTNGEDASGSTIIDSLTVAIDVATGAERWRTLYHPSGGSDGSMFAIAVSHDGSRVFTTGQSTSAPNQPDRLTVVAFDAATGSVQWTATPTGDQGRGVAITPDGSQLIVMGNWYSTPGLGYVVASLDPATGTQRWWSSYNTPQTSASTTSAEPYAMAISPDGGQVAVTGSGDDSTVSMTHAAATTLDLSTADGHQRWVATYSATPAEVDTAVSIAFAPDSGSVYVAGDSNINQGTRRYLTIAYNAAGGAQSWVQLFSNGDTDAATAVGVAPDGKTVYVTGASVNATTATPNEDFATLAYDSATGTQRWLTRYAGPGNDLAEELRVSPDGSRIYVAGQSNPATGNAFDSLLIAYDTSGAAVSSARWDDPSSVDEMHGLDVSGDGSRVVVAGRVETSAGEFAYLALIYNPGGSGPPVPEAPAAWLMVPLAVAAAALSSRWRRPQLI